METGGSVQCDEASHSVLSAVSSKARRDSNQQVAAQQQQQHFEIYSLIVALK